MGVKTMKRITSILLVCVLALSLVGGTGFTISAYAAENNRGTENAGSTDIESLKAAAEDETSSLTEEATTGIISGVPTEDSTDNVTEELVEAVTEITTEAASEIATEADSVSGKEISEEISEEERIQVFTLDEAAMGDTSTTWGEADGALRAAAEIQEGFADFSQYMTSHVITVDGKTVESGSQVDPTKDFTLTLQFKLELEDMMADGLQYYYVLPEHISIGNRGSASSQITLYNSRRVAIGTYYIQEDVMYVTFPGYYEEVVTNFSQGASWGNTNNLTQIPVDWGIDKEVFLLDNCDLRIIKNASGYKTEDNGNLVNSYKITVKPKTTGASIDEITFSDTFRSTYLKWYEDYFGEGRDIKLSYYTEDGTLIDTEFYSIDDVTTLSGKTYKTNIYPISISEGGYFVVEYAGITKLEDRYAMDSKNAGDSYDNYAQASYPFYNPATNETETVSADTTIYGNYSNQGGWILKSADDDTKTKVIDGDTKTIVPYTVTVNKYRRYSMGGGIVNDSITDFGSGNVKQDVVYDTSTAAETYIVATDKNGTSEISQTWIVLDEDLYNQLTGLKGNSAVQLEALRKNSSLQKKLLAAINTAQGTAYTSFTDEAALKYVFTTEAAHDFVWFMPMDETPTTYTIHYSTIVGSEVGSFSNGASLWYTEYDSVPPGPGAGWTKPVKKVMNASKSNAGVYIDADGNYYVDYTITVGVEAGSAGFTDIYVYDALPSYSNVPVGDSGEKVTVKDWICLPDGQELTTNYINGVDKSNDAIIQSIATFSTDSTDPAVQSIVDNAYIIVPSSGRPVNRELGSLMSEKNSSYTNATDYILYSSTTYSGDALAAGQFTIGQTTDKYRLGDTYSLNGLVFLLGNLPGTEEGYTINIKYTMQINPCLIEALPTLLEESGEDYLYNHNTMAVQTSSQQSNGKWTWNYGIYGSGLIQRASSGYWIGKQDNTPILDKDVKSYDKATRTLTYKVNINEQKTAEGEDNTYELTDNLNISGVKYKANSLTLYDSDNNIIYTNVKGKSVASKYKKVATYTVTDSDTSANNFKLVLDNSSGVLTTGDKKLISMYMEYGVDFSDQETDVTLMNTVALRMKGYDKDNDVYYDELLGEDTSEYAVDKALDKGMLSGQQPSASNNYTAGFYIDINPDSDNAYQLKSLKVGDTFTVRDTLSKSLLLDIDNVNIYQTVEAAKTDITSSCKLSYNVKTGVFEIEVPVTNTKATYRMEYYAKVIGASGAKITISNSAIVLGTDVKEDNVKKNVYVPSISEDADAITSEIRFVKYDQYDVESRVKATFDLYYYDKTAKAWVLLTGEGGYDQIKTGEDGTASINNTTIVASQPIRMVTRGYWYKLVEVDTEEGYMVDSTPIYYYVMNGTALPTDATSVVGYTKYSLVELPAVGASTAELPIIYASNHKLSFNISKLDSGTLSNITGAEFTLYSDRECTQVLDVQEDEKGIISFNDIAAPLDTTLYMKETKTPTGYIDSEAVYEVTFEKGYITKATAITDEGEEALSSKDTTERSVLTVKNDAINGRIRVSKTVNAYTTALKSRDEFSFSLKLYDENGNLVDKTFPAVKTDAQGNETETTVRNGVVFTLANGENLYVYDITPGTTYRIEEIADNRYTVSGNIVDKKGNDSKSISSTGIASGTVETGGYDEVQYTNTLLRSMEIVKKCVTDRGEALDIPDGHEIIITTSSTSSTSGIKVIATWDAQQKKYIATYLSSSTMSFDNSIENGFKVEGLSNGYLYVYEKNADIDGYGYALTYNSSATSTSYVSSSYEYIKVSSVNSGAETYLNMLNTYTDNYVEQEVGVDKTLENGKLKAEQFEFTLSEKLPGATAFVAVDTLTNDKAGNISFNRKYTSKDVGDWIYKLSENLPSGAKYSNGVYTYQGVQYDRESLYIKVTVALEEENGKLQVSEPVFVNSSGTEAEDVKKEFVNTYKASGSIKLTGTKKSENRSSSDKYTFTVTEYDKNYENPLKDAEGNLITATGKTTSGISKNATADITFNSIKYTETDIGVHYYIVTEDIPETADENNCLDGFTYDTSQFKVKVTVTDNGDGTLSAVTSYEKDKEGKDINIAFVNTYEAEGSVTLAGTKTLTYRDIAEDEYGFTVTEYTNASRTTIKKNSKGVAITYDAGVEAATMDNSTQKSTANITFPEISYKLSAGDVGTHYYKVTENIPSDAKNNMKAGVTYSTKSYNVTVVVSDNGKGALNTTVTYNSGNILFENSYQASGSIQFTGIKTLMGRALSAQEFNFEVYTTITYANGITQTSDTATAFGYNNADGSIYFPVLSYTQADIGNKYEYVIQETLPDRPSSAYKEGVTYSSEIYTVTVDVQDATKGELNLVTTVTNSDGEEIKSSTDKGAVKLDFTNLYNAENKLTFTATKFLEGRTIEAEQFTFGIYENDQLVATGTNDADGNIEFEPISYYIRSTATSVEKYIGQHTYVIKEVIPEVRASGYDYDTTQYEVSVNAADNGNGTISLTVTGAALLEEDTSQTVTGSPTSDTITYSVTKAEDKKGNFNNTYGAKGSITFAGSKTLEGRTLDKGEFTFEAVEYKIVEDERTATGNVYTGTNDADGNISFETISYIQNGSRKDTGNYVYVVTEVVPEQEKLGGVTYDKETSYEVQVVVTDKGDGTLETMASANYKSLDFTNIYEASGSLEMDITKKVVEATGQTYNDKNTDGTYMNNIFEFDIYDVEEEDSLLEILYAGAGKTVKASTFNYTLADVGLHTYKLVEKNTENPGYTFDDTVYYVNVLVEDNRDGTLKLSLTDDKGEAIGDVTGNQAEYSITFTNTYSAAGSVTFEGSKAVSHQADMLSAYELGNGDFKFNVYDVTGTADTRDISVEGRNPVTTGVSKEDGSIEFGTISYNLSEVGTHTYYIQEDSKTTVSGIINTATGVIATVIVSNAGDGTLTAQATYMDSKGKKLTEASFTNSASSVSLRKTDSENNLLAGAVLQIVDPAGNVVTTITSEDKSASVVYGLETDTTYTLHEISAPEGYELAKDISFMIGIDNQTYILSGSSKKAADVIVMVDELTDVPEEDTHTPDNTDTPGSTTGDGSNTQETPTTGDDSNIPFAMLLLMLSLVVVAGLCSKKRII